MTERRNIVSLSSPPMLLETHVFIFCCISATSSHDELQQYSRSTNTKMSPKNGSVIG